MYCLAGRDVPGCSRPGKVSVYSISFGVFFPFAQSRGMPTPLFRLKLHSLRVCGERNFFFSPIGKGTQLVPDKVELGQRREIAHPVGHLLEGVARERQRFQRPEVLSNGVGDLLQP